MKRVAFAALLVVVQASLCPSAALAFSTGSVTNAYSNAEWTKATFNVAVTPGVCVGTGYCSFHPVVLAQPNLPSYNCKSGEFGDSDRNTEVAWFGPTLTSNAAYSAAVSEVPILNRVVGQRLCLELVGENEYVSALCESQRKIIEEFTGKPSAPCPPEKFFFQEYASGGSALLTVAPPPVVTTPPVAPVVPVTTAPVTTPAPTPTPTTPPKPKLKCPKTKKKVTTHGKQICVKKKPTRHKKAA